MNQKKLFKPFKVALFVVVLSGCGSDSNPASGVSTVDTEAPIFNGLSSATAIGSYSASLSWSAATDNVSAAAAIQYNAYVASSSGAQNFSTASTSVKGASDMILSGLSAASDYYIVVRAQDESGNEDSNSTEIMLSTGSGTAVSFSASVQPIFTASCTGLGCHAGVMPAANLDLTAGKSYSQLVNVNAAGCTGTEVRVTPSDSANSVLAHKILGVNLCSGTQMPKGGTPLSPTEIQIITDWIDAGALDN